MTPRRSRWRAAVVLSAGVLALTVARTGAQGDVVGMRASFAADMFTDLGIPEAMSALTAWLGDLSRTHGFGDRVEVTVRNDLDSLVADFAADRLDVAVLRTPAFLRLRARARVEPLVAGWGDGLAEIGGHLVVSGQSAAARLEDLKGQGVIVLETPGGGVARLWFEAQLLKRGYPSLEAFFGSVKVVQKASQVVLPVFFGQAAAGIVDEPSWQVLGELNPQVVRDVRVLLSSPALLPHLVCVRSSLDPARKAELASALVGMKDEPRGQQTLALFKTRALRPFDPAWLTAITTLVDEHATLEASLKKAGRPGGVR